MSQIMLLFVIHVLQVEIFVLLFLENWLDQKQKS